MSDQFWAQQPPPDVEGIIWSWELLSTGQLPAVRAELRALLALRGLDPVQDADVQETFLLAFDELASNGIRHGGRPVSARVVAGPGGLLIDVCDAAVASPPAPAVDRDPSRGGLGLGLVAALTSAHGWARRAGRKHVWALCTPGIAPVTPAG
ncbi:ATP-binding protein [Blastococcus sp. TF02-8]|uniref:ATP-binding protein n=1 Tax=Blastococcus sp. TF02-8 TaxID=2250574 RepID=UPI000DEB90C7|nr:ATP-binding protein [Blastococcus sp. TF02-8]RBY96891.1 ATP-binding protein [Blastococcus sp. TF02-8]